MVSTLRYVHWKIMITFDHSISTWSILWPINCAILATGACPTEPSPPSFECPTSSRLSVRDWALFPSLTHASQNHLQTSHHEIVTGSAESAKRLSLGFRVAPASHPPPRAQYLHLSPAEHHSHTSEGTRTIHGSFNPDPRPPSTRPYLPIRLKL